MKTCENTLEVADEVRLAYTSYGPKSDVPIVLCPGLGATQLGYQADARALAEMGRWVITLDLRGLGKSTAPSTPVKDQFTPRQLAQDIVQLCDYLNVERLDFVGNSLGGLIGLEMIDFCPFRVRSLTTYGTTYELNLPYWVVPLQAFSYQLLGKHLAKFVSSRASNHIAAQKIIHQQYQCFPKKVGKMMSANVHRYSYLNVLDRWGGPILMLRGEHDRAINNNLTSTLDRLECRPNFQLVEVSNAGHFTNLDAPEIVRNAIYNFTEKLD